MGLIVWALGLPLAGCGDSQYVQACMARHDNGDGTYGGGLDKSSARNLCKAFEKEQGGV
jgi:hypothetical protein